MALCEKCRERPAEYKHPGHWCFNCWTEWWVEGLEIKDPEERKKELRTLRAGLKEWRSRKKS